MTSSFCILPQDREDLRMHKSSERKNDDMGFVEEGTCTSTTCNLNICRL